MSNDPSDPKDPSKDKKAKSSKSAKSEKDNKKKANKKAAPELTVIKGQCTQLIGRKRHQYVPWREYIFDLFVAGYSHQELADLLSEPVEHIKNLVAGDYSGINFRTAAGILALHHRKCR